MWEENLFRRTSGERLQRDQSAFQEGVDAGLQVAEQIASWMYGQDETAALQQIKRDRKRLKGGA